VIEQRDDLPDQPAPQSDGPDTMIEQRDDLPDQSAPQSDGPVALIEQRDDLPDQPAVRAVDIYVTLQIFSVLYTTLNYVEQHKCSTLCCIILSNYKTCDDRALSET